MDRIGELKKKKKDSTALLQLLTPEGHIPRKARKEASAH